jgi:hypothetical protein
MNISKWTIVILLACGTLFYYVTLNWRTIDMILLLELIRLKLSQWNKGYLLFTY